MKKFLLAIVVISLFSCGGAGDGDARTDTTTMPADRGVMDTPTTDSNTSTGTYPINAPADTSPGTQATSGTPPASRSTTPGKNSGQRQ